MTSARFGDDPRFRLQLTPQDVESIDLAGIERVWSTGFENAAGWTFAIVGDIDVKQTITLARQYLGTLVSTSPEPAAVTIIRQPPPGIISNTVAAGTGDKATVFRLYSARAASTVENAVLADVATEIVTNRILARLREQLGDSYSPFASVDITPSADGGDDYVDVYFEIGAAPEQVAEITAALGEEMGALVKDGPTGSDFAAAIAVLSEQYGFVGNEGLADVLLNSHSGIGETTDEYVQRDDVLDDLQSVDVRSYLAAVIHLDSYIEIHAVPR